MSTDDPQWARERLRVIEQRLGEAEGWLARLNAEHHAAAQMTGDRRLRTLRSIENKIAEAAKHKHYLERLRDECSLQRRGLSASGFQGTLIYRSELKRAISLALIKRPDAADLDICRALDVDGAVELPDGYGSNRERSFEMAYKGIGRHKLEIIISKVRTDMRKKGLIPRRSS
jgi:hypothetical protein